MSRTAIFGGETAAMGKSQFEAAQLEAIRKAFAAFIGPMARILVDRTAKRARNIDELYKLLADEIPSESDRAKFLATRRA